MTEARPAPGERGGNRFAGNLSLAAARFRRERVAAPPGAVRRVWTIVGAGAIAAAVLILMAAVLFDPESVAWAGDLPRWARAFFKAITRFGKSEWYLVPSAVLIVAIMLADWTKAGRAVAAAWAEIGALAGFFFFAVAGAGLATDLVKWLVGRSRPELFADDGAFTFAPISFDAAHLSFPSGHATTVTAVVVVAVLIARRVTWIVAVLGVGAALICVSRVAVRAHFPSDVIAGIFVGTAFTVLLATWLGDRGIAFQRRADGALMPKTVAIRSVLRTPDGWGNLLAGLATALFGPFSAKGAPGK